LNYSYGSNTSLPKADKPENLRLNVISEESVLEGLTKAKELNPDVIVVLFHWGNEYQQKPSNIQKTIAHLAADNGADLIIGTHPHVLQPIEVIPTERGNTLVAYSLGNFVSNQRTKPRERSAILAVDLEVSEDNVVSLKKASIAPIYTSVSCLKRECSFQVLYAGLQEDEDLKNAPDLKNPDDGVRFISVNNNPFLGSNSNAQVVEEENPPQAPPNLSEKSQAKNEEALGAEPKTKNYAQPELGPVPGVGELDNDFNKDKNPTDSSVVEYPLILGAFKEDSPKSQVPELPNKDTDLKAQSVSQLSPKEPMGNLDEPTDAFILPAISKAQEQLAFQAGKAVISFFQAFPEPDELGYYLIWDSSMLSEEVKPEEDAKSEETVRLEEDAKPEKNAKPEEDTKLEENAKLDEDAKFEENVRALN
jgi:hypothetical protein